MKRILLIDDDMVTLQLTSKFLRNFGFEVEDVSDSKLAMDKLMTPHYDLIISETEMNGLSGFDLCRMLQKYRIELPIVFLTAHDDQTTRDEASNIGVTRLISKRHDYVNLPHIVDAILCADYRLAG
jgi:DNA-binding response OmpR family regulator